MQDKRLLRMGINPKSFNDFKKDIELLMLPDKEKKKIIIQTLRRMKDITKDKASNQMTPTGLRWKPRKHGNYKMLRSIAKKLSVEGDNKKGRLYFKLNKTARIAAEHQYGLDNHFNVSDFKDRRANSEPCTSRQAKKLKDLGYRIPVGRTKTGRTKWKNATIKEIKIKLTIDQAGVIIRKMMNTGKGRGLKSWIIPTTKRPFLDERQTINAEIMRNIVLEVIGKE